MRGYKRPSRRRYRVGRWTAAIRRLPEWLALMAACAAIALAIGALSHSVLTAWQNKTYAEWHSEAQSAVPSSQQPSLQRMGMPDGSPISANALREMADTESDIVQSTRYHLANGPMLPEMETLHRKNIDLRAWLTIDSVLDLPVVYKNNQFYLDHDFSGNKNTAGTLFLDEFHPLRETTQHLLIHGHNMKDGSMFGLLTHYQQPDFWRLHPFIQLSTLWEKEEYVIFAVLNVPMDSQEKDYVNYFTHPSFASDAEFQAYIADVRRLSVIPCYLNVQPEDALLSLSTCIGNRRLVVAARRIRPTESRSELKERIK